MPTPCPVIVLRGELSEATRARTHATLMAGLADSREGLIVDVSAVTFIDSQGLRMLVACLRAIAEQGGSLALVGVQSEPFIVFGLLGAARVFHLFDSVAEARTFLGANGRASRLPARFV